MLNILNAFKAGNILKGGGPVSGNHIPNILVLTNVGFQPNLYLCCLAVTPLFNCQDLVIKRDTLSKGS